MKRFPFLLTVGCTILYLGICIAAVLLRMPYWHLQPDSAPDFDANNARLMWLAIASFPLSLIGITWQMVGARHHPTQKLHARFSCFALMGLISLYVVVNHTSSFCWFYESTYCMNEQKTLYRKDISSFTKQHRGYLPRTLNELSVPAGTLGCTVHYITFLPIPPTRKPYALNDAVAGKRLADIPHPGKVVLLADSRTGQNIRSLDDIDWERHRGDMCVVTFCDGHSEIFYHRNYLIVLDPWHDAETNR